MPCRHRIVGRVYRSKKWAKRWAGKRRRVRKVKGGYKIVSKR